MIALNPRPYGSLALGLAVGAGLNLPAIWVDLLVTGSRGSAPTAPACATARAAGWGRAAIVRPRTRTVHSIFPVGDPAPLLTVLERATDKLAKAPS